MKRLIFLSLFLTACSSYQNSKNGAYFCDEQYQYCLSKEKFSSESEWKPSVGMHGTQTSHTSSNQYPANDPRGLYMEIYNEQCPLTIQHMEGIEESTNTIWGKVEYKQSNDPVPGENNVFCPPLKPAKSAYAFCAQKKGKTVAICIQQMTDDPQIAEDIFKTFRWTN